MGVLSALRSPARAGGGHSFHSSGGGGHSSSGGGGTHIFYAGGGGGGGGGVGGIIFAVIVVIVVLAVIFFIRRRRKAATAGGPSFDNGPGSNPYSASPTPGGGSYQGGTPAINTVRGDLFPGTHPDAAAGQGDGVGAIAAHDPAFDEAAFLEEVQRSFFIVQEAWTERKPEMSRQVMADGLWQQHRVQIQGYIDENKRNILGDLAVGNLHILSAHTDATYDTIIVRVTAACSDYDVDVSKNKVVRGNKKVEQWSEDWTFQRSSKATTKPGGGSLAGKCPNCGAPLNVDLAGVCGYCHAPVMSGEYDWVLARIAQLGI